MKNIILATMVAGVIASGASANAFTHWFTHDIPAAAKLATKKTTYWMTPHKGDKSFKARERHCEAIGGAYDNVTQECGILDKVCKDGWKVYTSLARLPKTKADVNCNLAGI